MKKLSFIFLLLMLLPGTLRAEERLYRALVVQKNFDAVYALLEQMPSRHYGQSWQCIQYPGRAQCALYNSMADRNAYLVEITTLEQGNARVAFYTTDLLDERMRHDIDKFIKQLQTQ